MGRKAAIGVDVQPGVCPLWMSLSLLVTVLERVVFPGAFMSDGHEVDYTSKRMYLSLECQTRL